MRIRVVTEAEEFAQMLGGMFDGGQHEVELDVKSVDKLLLRYSSSTDLSQLGDIITQIRPLQPQLVAADDLGDYDAELLVGDSSSFSDWDIKVFMADEAEARTISKNLLSVGFRDLGIDTDRQSNNRLEYGGAPPLARQIVRWHLAKLGYEVEENKTWGDDDNDMYVRLTGGSTVVPADKDIRTICDVEICGDDLASMDELRGRLAEIGFTKITMWPIDPSEGQKFGVTSGVLDGDFALFTEVKDLIKGMLGERGVDLDGYPLQVGESARAVRIQLPLGAHGQGTLRPYAGDRPDRWEIVLRTDDPAAVQPMVDALAAEQLEVDIQPVTASTLGFRFAVNEARDYTDLTDGIQAKMANLLSALGFGSADPKLTIDGDMRGGRIEIDLPVGMMRDGSIVARLRRAASSWDCSLKTQNSSDYTSLERALVRMDFKEFERESTTVSTPVIKYGGAPRTLIEYIAGMVKDETGLECNLNKAWSDSDDDIWIHLPAPDGKVEVPSDDEGAEGSGEISIDSWFPHQESAQRRDLVEVGHDAVRIAHVTLPRRTDPDLPFIPPWQQFRHYCLDQRTAETLLHVAEGVKLREPVLLEGETSVSKTSIIQFLAMLLGQPLVRLNLNGQTDTGELVGRFLPQNVASDLPVDPDELRDAMELLEEESKQILTRAKQEDRPLTQVEVQQVMANERMQTHPWKWQDGLIVSAMKEGWWVVLDELNLAEPQILERLNSVLEREPSLVLTEHDNTVLGRGGIAVHPNFRIFATMNPAEYAGRSALSPAYRDRWRGYRYVDPPSEADYHAMLSFLVSGRQPDVALRGRPFGGSPQPPAFGTLAELPGIDGFLTALARFHTALESSVRNPDEHQSSEFGVRRQERYVFTRRGLLAVMDYLAGNLDLEGDPVESMRVALTRYYIGRIASRSDRATLVRLLDAAGIGLKTWNLDPT